MTKPEIRLAKTAGFCFGVDRTVKLLNAHLDGGGKACTLGPLIHRFSGPRLPRRDLSVR